MIWRWPALALSALFAASLAWLAGFAAFERQAAAPAEPPALSDGIVVLTGGAERVETGLRLFTEGRAPRLLVSGVGGGSDLADLLHRRPAELAGFDGHAITLGRAAIDTVGNAAEAAAWVREHDIRTLIVVTAGYHMQRALREFARALPGVELRPVPVRPAGLRGREDLGMLRLLTNEYDKLLTARLGLHRLITRAAKA